MTDTNHTWSVFCPGPSLGDCRRYGLGVGGACSYGSIAVNHAIVKYPQCRIWAVQDWAVFDECCDKVFRDEGVDKPIVWAPSSWLVHEHKWIERHGPGAFSVHGFRHVCFSKAQLMQMMPFGCEIQWDEYTFFTALAYAVMSGARHINIFGADMEGEGYCVDTDIAYQHEKKRWTRERHAYEQIRKECWARNITLRRVFV